MICDKVGLRAQLWRTLFPPESKWLLYESTTSATCATRSNLQKQIATATHDDCWQELRRKWLWKRPSPQCWRHLRRGWWPGGVA
eukprot:6465928-Amphidinium_carterae.1